MNCLSCGHESREGAAFCGGCGQSLAGELRCPQYDSPNPAGQRFCGSCGNSLIAADASQETRDPRSYPKHLANKVLQSKSAPEGERKQVTVLFEDVKDSIGLALCMVTHDSRYADYLDRTVHLFDGRFAEHVLKGAAT